MTTQSVQVKIELGHKAELRRKQTTEGFTHDWTIFVRGPEGSNIQHFVEKVVFYLHDSFPKPKRVVKEPPYQVTESGYGSFTLPVEIYFKTKEEPRKISFEYDLFLHLDGAPPVNHTRCEKLTFKNPTEEFRRKLIAAGGVGILGSHDGAAPLTSQRPTVLTPQTTFNDLFGAPIHATTPAAAPPVAPPPVPPQAPPAAVAPETKHKHGDGHKRHKSHKEKDRDRDHRKKSKSSKSHNTSSGGSSQPTSNSHSAAPKVSPPAESNITVVQSAPKKHSSEDAAPSEVPAKKKKKDKDRDHERSKSSTRDRERHDKHDKHKSSKSSSSNPTGSSEMSKNSSTEAPKNTSSSSSSHDKSKDKHRHSSTSSRSHKSHKKSHKEKHHHHHQDGSKHHSSSSSSSKPAPEQTDNRSPVKSPVIKSPVKSPLKSPAKSPVKEHAHSGYKKPKSMQDKPSLPPLEVSTGELSDDPFEDEHSEDEVVSPDMMPTSQPPPKISAKADSRSKDFMKSLFDEGEEEEDEDMDVEVVTPKASPAVESLPAVLSPLHPSPKPVSTLSPSPRSHTLSPRPDKSHRVTSPQKTPDKTTETTTLSSSSSSRRHKSHTSPSSASSPLTAASAASSQRPWVDQSSRKHSKNRDSSSSSSKSRPLPEPAPKPAPAPAPTPPPISTSRRREAEPEVAKRKSLESGGQESINLWDSSPSRCRPREDSWPPPPPHPATNTSTNTNSTVLAKSNKISPPRFSMDPPDLLKSTQHSDFGFQSSQRCSSVPDLEKENQGVENHGSAPTGGTTTSSTKAPLLENGTDLPENLPGHAPNGEAFHLLLWLQEKLNATKDEGVLSEVVHILEDSGEVFSMTDSSLDFDLCYLNSNTVHRLKQCLQMS